MDILKRNGRKYKVYFLNKYFERPQYFDAIILDNHTIKIALVKDPNTKSIIKSTVEGSVETDKLFKADYDRTMERWKKGIKLWTSEKIDSIDIFQFVILINQKM